MYFQQPWVLPMVPPSLVLVSRPCPSCALSWSWSRSFPSSWRVSLPSMVWSWLCWSLVPSTRQRSIPCTSKSRNVFMLQKYINIIIFFFIPIHKGIHPFGCWSVGRLLWSGCWFCHWNRRWCWCPWYCATTSSVRRNDPYPHFRRGLGSVRSDRRHLPVHEISYSPPETYHITTDPRDAYRIRPCGLPVLSKSGIMGSIQFERCELNKRRR